ncbi:Uncharacterized protein Fot_45570 [Forsythia ovata]|uniref:Uncharacterized protein n=1 Tax=Forsythia ovata TaxID=205694 RepID=A0ABD1R7Q6_9LAMI
MVTGDKLTRDSGDCHPRLFCIEAEGEESDGDAFRRRVATYPCVCTGTREYTHTRMELAKKLEMLGTIELGVLLGAPRPATFQNEGRNGARDDHYWLLGCWAPRGGWGVYIRTDSL